MIETIIVSVIVGAVVIFAGRSLYRTLTGKDSGCAGCGTKSCGQSEPCHPTEPKSEKPH